MNRVIAVAVAALAIGAFALRGNLANSKPTMEVPQQWEVISGDDLRGVVVGAPSEIPKPLREAMLSNQDVASVYYRDTGTRKPSSQPEPISLVRPQPWKRSRQCGEGFGDSSTLPQWAATTMRCRQENPSGQAGTRSWCCSPAATARVISVRSWSRSASTPAGRPC